MTEINNNEIGKNINIAKSTPIKKEDVSFGAENKAEENTKQVQDLGNNPQEAIGRSQVAKADNLKSDLKTFKNNPDLVMHADQFFDYTYEQLSKEGREDAYEQAVLATAQFVNEFSKKPQVTL